MQYRDPAAGPYPLISERCERETVRSVISDRCCCWQATHIERGPLYVNPNLHKRPVWISRPQRLHRDRDKMVSSNWWAQHASAFGVLCGGAFPHACDVHSVKMSSPLSSQQVHTTGNTSETRVHSVAPKVLIVYTRRDASLAGHDMLYRTVLTHQPLSVPVMLACGLPGRHY